MKMWCVVHTLPHGERRAEENLLRQGFRAWLPSILRTRRHARRLDTVHAPLFPGYLCVELDPDREPWSRINGSFGVRRLITDGVRPLALPRGFVETIRSELSPGSGAELQPGTRVHVVAGPFADMVATVVGLAPGERVRLLLSVLGGQVRVTAPRRSVITVA